MKIFNLNADEWDRAEEREGWRFKDAWVGAHTDAELIGASMYEVEPGNKQGQPRLESAVGILDNMAYVGDATGDGDSQAAFIKRQKVRGEV